MNFRPFWRIWLLSLVLICSAAADQLIVTGGPALRRWEDYRTKDDRHDRWWANFVRASTLRMDEIRANPAQKDVKIVWLVFRPGYSKRGNEDFKPYANWISELAEKRRAQLIWFSSKEEFIKAMNQRPRRSVDRFEYFGHSNRYAFMFEYGTEIIAASTEWFHQNDISRIKKSIFARGAYCKSWGCHTGESMSGAWKRELGLPMVGALGPTNYSMVGRGALPAVSGSWSQ